MNGAKAEIRSLRGEIAGLQAQLSYANALRRAGAPAPTAALDRLPLPEISAASNARRMYAVPAIGDVSPVAIARSVEHAVRIYDVPVITNLGTMMDVLM